MATKIVQIEVFHVWSCVPGEYYDCQAIYDEWDDAVKDIRPALEAGRNVMVERELMTEDEYHKDGEPVQEGENPLLP